MRNSITMLIDEAIRVIDAQVAFGRAPVALVSFGKDSMVILGLLREAKKLTEVQILTVRNPSFASRYAFADRIIHDWHLTPVVVHHGWNSVIAGRGQVDLLGTLRFGKAEVHMPVANTAKMSINGKWSCALDSRLKQDEALASFEFDRVFLGSKATDVDPVVGKVQVAGVNLESEGTHLIFPLRNWTDEHVWSAIGALGIPYDSKRYVAGNDGKFVDDLSYSEHPEYLPICTTCVNPEIKSSLVFCPKKTSHIQSRVPELTRRSYPCDEGSGAPLQIVAL